MNETTSTSSFPYELTIGMIVKNEAHRLRGCLEGLAPLRAAISCELILTDTGSTDGTQEIAKEFADVYLEFDWCDDFSKARNTATSIAKGRWYLYLDADHTFDESLLALADFLKSPQSYTPIQAATLSIRNYTNAQGTHYLDSTSCLLHNFSKGPKEFVYPIHECIQFYGHAPLLPTLIHHWGYLVEGEKQQRNHPILCKAIQEDPFNFHHHHHLIRDTTDLTLRKQYLDTALSYGEQDESRKKDPFYWTVCLSFCQWAWDSQDLLAFSQGKQRLLPIQENTFLHLELLGMELSLSLEREEKEGLVSLFSQYQKVFHHLDGQESLPFRSSFRYQFTTARNMYLMEARIIKYFIATERKQEAITLLSSSTILSQTKEDGSHPYLGDYCNFALSVGGFSVLRSYHETLVNQGCLAENDTFVHYLEKQFASLDPEEKQNFLLAFSAYPTTSYTGLWALRHSGYQYANCPSLALQFLEHSPDLYRNPLYRDVFYSSFRSKEDRFSFMNHLSLERLTTWQAQLFQLDPQFHKLIFLGLDHFALANTPLLQRNWGYLGIGALVEVGRHAQGKLPLGSYYEKTVKLLTAYLTAVYQIPVLQEALRPDQPSLLPPQERFALFACTSLSQTQNIPDKNHPLLAQGLELYPSMKPLLDLL